jgi:hypothetical protein
MPASQRPIGPEEYFLSSLLDYLTVKQQVAKTSQ